MTLTATEIHSATRRRTAKVAIDGVSKRFGDGRNSVLALDHVDLAIGASEFFCLVGPSGCGKTTMLNILAGYDRPTSGTVLMNGVPLRGPGPDRGVVFQQGALFTWMSVADNVAFGPRAMGKSKREARQIADHYINLVGLGSFASRYPYELSGGMQQRVGIARALANSPELLLMDEPFAALDVQTRELLQEEIKRIWKETRKTIFWITHSIEEALFLATSIAVMTARPGRIKAAFEARFTMAEDHRVTVTAEFTNAKRQVLDLLREETMAAQKQEARE
jgi:ABC-type nitrate/sulfonate/bicarbonate transport system ATPase subunit